MILLTATAIILGLLTCAQIKVVVDLVNNGERPTTWLVVSACIIGNIVAITTILLFNYGVAS